MSGGRLDSLRGLPPFLVGAATATSAEVGAALLLYSGPGMLRSLTTVLVVDSAALALGLWSVPREASGLADALRRRWLLYLTSILAATIFAGVWSLMWKERASGLEQGLGLALLAALPLYACGALLGVLSAGSPAAPSGGPARVGAWAVAGGTIGFAATGLTLTHVLTPASLLLTALALVSAGGLVHGSILDSMSEPDAEPSQDGDDEAADVAPTDGEVESGDPSPPDARA